MSLYLLPSRRPAVLTALYRGAAGTCLQHTPKPLGVHAARGATREQAAEKDVSCIANWR
ncbi:MAG TPA: hypothetical protein VEL76_28525 [Gemmataceae bacterium]|nr:hypothetical protein [Gemmataceae bacterium]